MANIRFSHRQLEIIKSISEGKTAPEIADELGVALSTLNSHRSMIYRVLKRFGVTNREELIQYARENELA